MTSFDVSQIRGKGDEKWKIQFKKIYNTDGIWYSAIESYANTNKVNKKSVKLYDLMKIIQY